MKLKTRMPVKRFTLLCLSLLFLGRCASVSKVDLVSKTQTAKRDSTPQSFQIVKFMPERVNSQSLAKATAALSQRKKLASLAAGFSLERPQSMDEGIYGKVGLHSVFIAPTQKIPDYDRLYWVMVRVLSEKYGCFIRKKTSTARTVSFECRDHRTVVMDRDISASFAMFTGRQYDRNGRIIDMRRMMSSVKTALK